MPATYTVVVTAIDSFDADVATQTVSVVVSRPEQQFLPVVFKNFTPPELPADLRCTLTINPPTPSSGQPVLITVEINNQGEGSADGFWVDLYINPASPPIPGRSNRIRWEDACGGPSSCQRGIAWRISNNPLFPPNSRTLISIPADLNPTGGQGFDRNNSNWPSGILPAGVYNFYAYVDSINGENVTIDGAVREVNESNNRCEGNLVVPASVSAETDEAGSSNLPQRPTPP